MTNAQMFKLAHSRAREDVAYNPQLPEIMRNSYAYYFRLQLIQLQAIAREQRTGLVRGFQIIEPKRLWA